VNDPSTARGVCRALPLPGPTPQTHRAILPPDRDAFSRRLSGKLRDTCPLFGRYRRYPSCPPALTIRAMADTSPMQNVPCLSVVGRDITNAKSSQNLGGHLKTGHRGSPQNRPTARRQAPFPTRFLDLPGSQNRSSSWCGSSMECRLVIVATPATDGAFQHVVIVLLFPASCSSGVPCSACLIGLHR